MDSPGPGGNHEGLLYRALNSVGAVPAAASCSGDAIPMTSVSKWVAAGSAAAVFAGGLCVGTPMAMAAPGDAACLAASGQYEAALAAAGMTAESYAELEALAEAAAVAEEAYFQALEVSIAAAEKALNDARLRVAEADAAEKAAEVVLEDAQESGDEAAIEAAQAALTAAKQEEDLAEEALELLESAPADAAANTPEVLAALEALEQATAALEDKLAGFSLDQETSDAIMALFEAFLDACNPDAIGVDPVVTPPAVTTPVGTSGGTTPGGSNPASVTPVGGAPVGGTTAVPVAGVNRGLNVQTAAAAAEPVDHPGLALLAGLLAAGIVVPTAVALRMRRLERSHR